MVLGKWFHFLFPYPLWQSCWFRLQAFVPGHVSRGYLNINYKKQTFTTDQEDDHWTKEGRAHFLFCVFPFCLANVGPRWMMIFPKYSLPYVVYHGGDTSLVLSFKSCPLSKKRQSLFWHHISCSSSTNYQPEHERPHQKLVLGLEFRIQPDDLFLSYYLIGFFVKERTSGYK